MGRFPHGLWVVTLALSVSPSNLDFRHNNRRSDPLEIETHFYNVEEKGQGGSFTSIPKEESTTSVSVPSARLTVGSTARKTCSSHQGNVRKKGAVGVTITIMLVWWLARPLCSRAHNKEKIKSANSLGRPLVKALSSHFSTPFLAAEIRIRVSDFVRRIYISDALVSGPIERQSTFLKKTRISISEERDRAGSVFWHGEMEQLGVECKQRAERTQNISKGNVKKFPRRSPGEFFRHVFRHRNFLTGELSRLCNETGKTRRLRISNASYAARTHSSQPAGAAWKLGTRTKRTWYYEKQECDPEQGRDAQSLARLTQFSRLELRKKSESSDAQTLLCSYKVPQSKLRNLEHFANIFTGRIQSNYCFNRYR